MQRIVAANARSWDSEEEKGLGLWEWLLGFIIACLFDFVCCLFVCC